ncbi:unnamed protein product [Dovyalis caffra]|uniref:Transcription factor TFIIIB component B'' Myb domain-containing protein n=1 Tax=Dovyalis caffra TaxID=77055 RepID=A0AAV1R9H9_9ROSI|nr:unnamed protein product [Dovyalis caffra]
MDPDLDPFDDILPKPALTNARAGGKFQPKAKLRPKKTSSLPIPSIPPSNAKEKAVTASQTSLDTANSVQPVDIMDEKLRGQNGLLSPSAPIGTKEPLENNDEKTKLVAESGNPLAQLVAGSGDSELRDPLCSSLAASGVVGVKEPQKDNEGLFFCEIGSLEAANLSPVRRNDVGSVGAMESDATMSDCNGDQKSSFVKLAGEAGSLGLDSDLLDDILPKPLKINSRAGGKFKPKAKPQQRNENLVPVSSSPSKCTEGEPETHSLKTQSAEAVDVPNTRMSPVGPPLLKEGNIESNEPSKDSEVSYASDNSCLGLVNPTSEKIATEEGVSPQNTQLAEVKAGNYVGLHSRFGESAMEVGSMRLDLDAFDYMDPIPAISTGRAGGKFQPKAKAQPRKETSELVASAVLNTAVEKVAGLTSTVWDKMLPIESSGVEDGSLICPVDEPIMETTKEPGRNNREVLSPPEILATVSGEKDTKGKSIFPMRNSVDSSAFMKHDVVATDSVSPNEAAVQFDNGRSELEESGVFPDLETRGFLPPDAMEFVMPSPPNVQLIPSETINIDGCSVAAFPSDNIEDSSSVRLGDFIPPNPCTSEIRIDQEPKNLTETYSDNVFAIHQEDVSAVPEKEASSSRKVKAASASYSSQKSQKASSAGDMNESDKSSTRPRMQAAAPQIGDEPEDEAHHNGGFPSDIIDDDSSIRLGNFIPVDPCTSEFQVDQNQKDFTESNCSANANVAHSEDVPIVPEKESSKIGKRKVSSASNCSLKSKKSALPGDVNKGKKSSRQLRKQAAGPQVVDEPEDEVHDNSGLPAEPPSSSVDEEDNDYEPRGDEESDGEYRVETTSRKKRTSKKTKEPASEKEKPVRKRKRSNDTPEQSTQEPRKKFSHSTRRNKRCVNKDLLNMPEDEIDFKRLPIRDIILFAEYKERLAMKEAAASKTSPNNQSTDNPFHGEYSHNEEDGFASEQDRTNDDDQTYVRAQPSSSLFNHQSFMDRAPNSRWSKQDTELFYEKVDNFENLPSGYNFIRVPRQSFPCAVRYRVWLGIRQFGTDLSMIQQLFPGRTRHQVKLKYKKEERQYPLRLHEALSSRPKDHSYFEKLIEQLQEVAATQEGQESYKDDLVDVSGEEATELNAETNDEVTKPEQDEDVGVEEEQEEKVAEEHHGPLKSGDSDEDVDIWSSYRSEF